MPQRREGPATVEPGRYTSDDLDRIVAHDNDPREDRTWALGPCGCTDYHMADCPLVSPPSEPDPGDRYDDYDGGW
jgi:hypothetical protein